MRELMDWLRFSGLATIAGLVSQSSGIGKKSEGKTIKEKGRTKVLRIYEDQQGNAHLQELIMSALLSEQTPKAQEVPALQVFLREYPPQVVDWHKAPARQFAVTVSGELEVEVSGGVRRRVQAGELVFLEDTKGKGHRTHLLSPVTNLYIRVPDDFDVVVWAGGNE
jgi:quercetin dioxygenase-like cupin family protein